MEKIKLKCFFSNEESDSAKKLGLGITADKFDIKEITIVKSKIDFYYEDDFYGNVCTMVMIGGGELCAQCTEQEFENLIK